MTEQNYSELQQLLLELKGEKFSILAFPCDQFKHQEPGTNEEIAAFAAAHGATFELFAKTDVNGPGQNEVYRALKKQLGEQDEDVAWNFVKFLVGKDGVAVRRYDAGHPPLALKPDIVELLQKIR